MQRILKSPFLLVIGIAALVLLLPSLLPSAFYIRVVALVFIASLKMKTIGVVGETPVARLAGTVEEISLMRRCLASREQPHQRIA